MLFILKKLFITFINHVFIYLFIYLPLLLTMVIVSTMEVECNTKYSVCHLFSCVFSFIILQHNLPLGRLSRRAGGWCPTKEVIPFYPSCIHIVSYRRPSPALPELNGALGNLSPSVRMTD